MTFIAHCYVPMNYLKQVSKSLCLLYLTMALVAFATNAVQTTPFALVDKNLLYSEQLLPVNFIRLMTWAQNYAYWLALFRTLYELLAIELIVLPIAMVLTRQFYRVQEFIVLLLLTTIIGFTIYYFFPTSGPASHYPGLIFEPSQYATGLKFQQIHHFQKPTTLAGGLISFPSFHTIWAALCCYLVRDYRFIFYPLMLLNGLIMFACVALGWHYLIDLFGSLMVLASSVFIYQLIIKPTPRGQI